MKDMPSGCLASIKPWQLSLEICWPVSCSLARLSIYPDLEIGNGWTQWRIVSFRKWHPHWQSCVSCTSAAGSSLQWFRCSTLTHTHTPAHTQCKTCFF